VETPSQIGIIAHHQFGIALSSEKVGKPNIEKMKTKGDVKGLIKALKDKNEG
jgi:hypothetical protein